MAYTEFETLETAASDGGHALKAVGQGTGTNTSGFSGLLADVHEYGSFEDLSEEAYFWSSYEADENNATSKVLTENEPRIATG